MYEMHNLQLHVATMPMANQELILMSSAIIWMIFLYTQFPEVCDYRFAKYSVSVIDDNQHLIYHSGATYKKDSQAYVPAIVSQNLVKNRNYTAEIAVFNAVQRTTRRFSFSKCSQKYLHAIVIKSLLK